MPPSLALLLWFIFLLALLYFDPARKSRTSLALWVPVSWMFITGSRLPSQWLGGNVGQVAQSLEEGSSLDRTVYFALIFLAIGILISRSFKWSAFCARNPALVMLLLFTLVSVLWSDFSFIALKRWFRDLGNYLMILVVLSDISPLEAVRAVLRRVGYLLIPLSIVLNKYYLNLSRQYDPWTGMASYVGATTSKNMLGIACLVCGLFFFWDTVVRWPERKGWRTRRIIFVNVMFLVMTFWLINLSNSATSRVCLVLGCLVTLATHSRWYRQRPGFIHGLIPAAFCFYLILAFGLDMNGALAATVGRDPTLTDRTKIWSLVLSMHTNPFIGTGYESFWLGPRLLRVWQGGLGGINEAHNGYLEFYLNLGLTGVGLLAWFLIASYRTICKRFKSSPPLASLGLAVWTALLFHSVTEADFRGGLLWLSVLMVGTIVPFRSRERSRSVVAFDEATAIRRFPLEPAGVAN
jgi:exopolysaccharide production protein ExoQ